MKPGQSLSHLGVRLGPASESTGAALRTAGTNLVYTCVWEVSQLPQAGRDLLYFAQRERTSWAADAARTTASAIFLVTDETIEFYTSDREYWRGGRPQVPELTRHTESLPHFRSIRIVERVGPWALRRLMNFAAGLWTNALGAHRAAAEIQTAAAVARQCNTLDHTLESVFVAAARVGQRVRNESAFHAPKTSGASRELSTPIVDQMIEEELAELRARRRHSIPEGFGRKVESSARQSASDEPSSQVRLRIAVPVDLKISYLEQPSGAIRLR